MGKSYSEKVRSRNARKTSESGSFARNSKKSEDKPPFPVLPMAVLIIIGVLIAAGIVMYAMDSNREGSGNDTENGENGDDNDDTPAPVPRGEILLDSTDGSDLYLDKYKGRVIVLDMFATWCNPCKIQMEELEKLESRFASNELVILSVGADLGETLAQIRQFEKEEGATWPFARSNQDFNSEFPATSIPTLYVLDTEGRTAKKFVGVTDADTMESEIRPLLY